MKITITATQKTRAVAIVPIGLGLLLTAPGFSIGFVGITDMAPSSPRGFAGLAELLGYLYCTWVIFYSTRLLIAHFLNNALDRIGYLVAASVLAYGFYLLMTVICLEASLEHKQAFIQPLQPLGWFSLLQISLRTAPNLWRKMRSLLN